MTPAVFRARATSLLVELAPTDVGRLVTGVVGWVRRQLVAEARCSYIGCRAPAELQALDGGPGGVCADHRSTAP